MNISTVARQNPPYNRVLRRKKTFYCFFSAKKCFLFTSFSSKVKLRYVHSLNLTANIFIVLTCFPKPCPAIAKKCV